MAVLPVMPTVVGDGGDGGVYGDDVGRGALVVRPVGGGGGYY